MRNVHRIFSALLCCLPWSATQAADSLDTVTRLAQGGASQLALARVEREQPDKTDLSRWLQWEGLRLSLLSQVHHPQQVLNRVAGLPHEVPAEFLSQAYQRAAEAALTLGQGSVARDYLSRLLWQPGLQPTSYKELRWQVIRSYLAQKQVAEAYPLMLRYSQEFAPLTPGEVATFVRELLALGAASEATAWLSALERGGSLRLLAELKSGLVSPEKALAAARAALGPAKPAKKQGQAGKQSMRTAKAVPMPEPRDNAGYWSVILEVATTQKDALLAAEAQERLLNYADGDGGLVAVSAEDLWQSYETVAREQGSHAQLLQGDDMAWFVLADGLEQTEPVAARSLYAYLAVGSKVKAIRDNALTRFVALLDETRLGLAAVSLFTANGHFTDGGGIPASVAAKLGGLALQNGQLPQAVVFWRRVDEAPDGVAEEDWQLKRARLFAAAGAYAELGTAARKLLAAKGNPTVGKARAMLEVTQDLSDAGQGVLARELLTAALPMAEEPVVRRQMLARLGELSEQGNEPQAAADYYLQVAALAEKSDPSASQARYRAACNLVRAGMAEDAKREYRVVLQNSRDAGLQASARRALARLS